VLSCNSPLCLFVLIFSFVLILKKGCCNLCNSLFFIRQNLLLEGLDALGSLGLICKYQASSVSGLYCALFSNLCSDLEKCLFHNFFLL